MIIKICVKSKQTNKTPDLFGAAVCGRFGWRFSWNGGLYVVLCYVPALPFSFPSTQISKTSAERGAVSAQQLGIHGRSKGECCCWLSQGAWLRDVDVYYGFFNVTDQSFVFLPQYTQTETEPSVAKTVVVIRCDRCSAAQYWVSCLLTRVLHNLSVSFFGWPFDNSLIQC